jgi:hypothetical protein
MLRSVGTDTRSVFRLTYATVIKDGLAFKYIPQGVESQPRDGRRKLDEKSDEAADLSLCRDNHPTS